MYSSQEVAERIRTLTRKRNISVKQLLEEVQLGTNTMSNMKTSMPKADNLAKIADYLNCSVDYLLGRTDNPDMTITVNQTGEIIESSPINAVNNAGKASDEMTAELSEIKTILDSLSVRDRHDLLSIIFNYGDTHIKK